MTPQTKRRDVEQVHVRMPKALYEAVEARAQRWGTSMNGAINVLVDLALEQPSVMVQCPHDTPRKATDARRAA